MKPQQLRLTSRILTLLAACMAASCGFHLRGDVSLPFQTIFLSVPQGTAMYNELRRSLRSGAVTLVNDPNQAQAILEVNSVVDDKQILSLSSGGKVREFLLEKHVLFRAHDMKGHEWVPTTDLLIRRTYTYNDTEALAKELEEQRLLREMESDAAQQIIRRLQAAKKPA